MQSNLERLAFYCQQCRTMVEGGVLNMGHELMVHCHGQTETVEIPYPPLSSTKDNPHVVQVFKKKPVVGRNAPKQPNVRFYCQKDDKIIKNFLYQHDNTGTGRRAGQVHVFVIKCTGETCGGVEHRRLFTEDALTDQQMWGAGPPLLLDLNPAVPAPQRRNKADVQGHDPENLPPSNRLPGMHDADETNPDGVLPPRRLITLEAD